MTDLRKTSAAVIFAAACLATAGRSALADAARLPDGEPEHLAWLASPVAVPASRGAGRAARPSAGGLFAFAVRSVTGERSTSDTPADLLERRPLVRKMYGEDAGDEFGLVCEPRVFVAGERGREGCGIRVTLSIERFGWDFEFRKGDTFAIVKSDDDRARLEIENIRDLQGRLRGNVAGVPKEFILPGGDRVSSAGYYDLVLEHANAPGRAYRLRKVFRVTGAVRVVLCFDDGPAADTSSWLPRKAGGGRKTPTEHVLDVLARHRIKAMFNVLTGPDTHCWMPWVNGIGKAEQRRGFMGLVRTISEGHVVGCHWGGKYEYQNNTHWRRTRESAYDAFDAANPLDLGDPDRPSTSDAVIDRATTPGNALESDLMQCMAVIRKAYVAAGKEPVQHGRRQPEFVRPPLYRFASPDGTADARPTYRALGLKMILSDGNSFDSGYRPGDPMGSKLVAHTLDAIAHGERDIILTMHDSNVNTARELEDIIALLRRKLARRGLVEGESWGFVSDTGTLFKLLRAKRRFRYPEYVDTDVPAGPDEGGDLLARK